MEAGDQTLPPLRLDLQLYANSSGENGEPNWTLFDPLANQFYLIGWLQHCVLKRWQRMTARQLCEHINKVDGIAVSMQQMDQIHRFLVDNRLVVAASSAQIHQLAKDAEQKNPRWYSSLIKNYFFIRIPLLKPDRFLQACLPWVNFFQSRLFKRIAMLLLALGLALTFRQWDIFVATATHFLTPGYFYGYIIALVFAKILHEFGHALVAKHYGCSIANMGIAFIIMWPILYTDTTDSWKLKSKQQRLRIGAAGVMVELYIAILATFLWSFFPEGAFRSGLVLLASTTWISTLLINLNPFMRFDGYFLLSDYIAAPNLQSRSFELARWRLREALFKWGEPAPESLTPSRKRLFLIYAYATWVYRLILYVGIAVLVYHLFFKLAGILLMLLELFVLLGLPVFRELRQWWARRGQIRMNRNLCFALIIFGTLLLALIHPWQTEIRVPAILTAAQQARVFSPADGQITELNVQLGQSVRSGDSLAVLTSPGLLQNIARTEKALHALQWQLDQAPADVQMLAEQRTLYARRVTLLSELDSYRSQLDQLTITAPFAGKIVALDDIAQKGQWIAEGHELMTIVNTQSAQIHAFPDEAQIVRIGRVQTAVFETFERPQPIAIELLDASPSSVQELDFPALASVFGGSIQASQAPGSNRLRVTEAVYQWTFAPVNTEITQANEKAGTVIMPAEPSSLFSRLLDTILAVFIRESGF